MYLWIKQYVPGNSGPTLVTGAASIVGDGGGGCCYQDTVEIIIRVVAKDANHSNAPERSDMTVGSRQNVDGNSNFNGENNTFPGVAEFLKSMQ